MKFKSILLVSTLVPITVFANTPLPDKTSGFQKNSYTLGLAVADVLKQNKRTVDVDFMARGVQDGLGQGDVTISNNNRQELYNAYIGVGAYPKQGSNVNAVTVSFGRKHNHKHSEKIAKTATHNPVEQKKVEKTAGPQSNKKAQQPAPAWEKTKSGLKYRVIKKGSQSVNPNGTDYVTVNYEGKLADGTVFDSSYKRGEPVEFRLDDVIPGWTEGVQLMSIGSTYEFNIPPELAYGKAGSPPVIPKNSTLTFKVELIDINA